MRNDYFKISDFPESIIPFSITLKEAKELLKEWCAKNRSLKEARLLQKHIDELQGSYLPYELIKGPVHMYVSRMDSAASYDMKGFVNGEFVNRSRQLDNRLLDGMEPFDLSALREFNFAYVSGQRVKIPDINEKALEERVREEVAETYKPDVENVFDTQAVEIFADPSGMIRLPVLLPVYYFREDELMAAVNGQTGKVSVLSLKPKHYYFLPWWFKALLATVVICVITGSVCKLFGMSSSDCIFISGALGLFLLVVCLCLYSDSTKNRFRVETLKPVYTSGDVIFKRDNRELVESDKVLKRKVFDPVFFVDIGDDYRPARLVFRSLRRSLQTILLAFTALFLPVILALFINGFDFKKIHLGGCAVWFCIMVPVVPIYLLKYAVNELYERPWIYLLDEGKGNKRYRQKIQLNITIGDILKALFVPPLSLAVWFGIISFLVMVYLTAGYGWD